MKHLRLHIENELATLTLNNPPQNRIGTPMLEDFEEAVESIANSGVRALIIRADGPDFSYGGYFPEWPGMKTHELRALFDRYLAVYNRFERLPFPTMAAVQGACWGGGFELAIRCDMIIAAPSAHFNHPEQTLAITTLLGGVYRLAERAGRNIAAEMAYTSGQLDAEKMHRHGVVNRIVPEKDLDKEVLLLASSLAHGATRAHAAHKVLLRLWALGGIQAADEALMDVSVPLFETEDTERALQSAEIALAKGEKRPVLQFKGR
jgi:Enoyl-CoA hydratase/carnithine racemase